MMKQVLKLLNDGGLLSKTEIANKVGIQESTLTSILSLLASKGYLKAIDSTDETVSGGCVGCSIRGSCSQTCSGIYIITEKGKNYLKN